MCQRGRHGDEAMKGEMVKVEIVLADGNVRM